MNKIEYCGTICKNGRICRKSMNCNYHRKKDKYEDMRKRYYCDNCGANYVTKKNLKRHLEDPINCLRKHNKEKLKVNLEKVEHKYNSGNIWEIYSKGFKMKMKKIKNIRQEKSQAISQTGTKAIAFTKVKKKKDFGFKIEKRKVIIDLNT